MKTNNRNILLLVILLSAAFAFQNCGKVQFSSDRGVLVTKNGDGPDVTETGDPSDPTDNPVITPTPTPPTTPPTLPPSDDDDDDDYADDTQGMWYICILDGNGKSNHIGYLNGSLSRDINTPDSVCMSQKACLQIAAEVFPVVSAEKRGFCPNKNPHVVPMTDAQMTEQVEEIKSQL